MTKKIPTHFFSGGDYLNFISVKVYFDILK